MLCIGITQEGEHVPLVVVSSFFLNACSAADGAKDTQSVQLMM